ncbi:MAG: hypothetical protein RL701_5721 [Pseudomonadota bacterium]|jgi:hypothetical protein
MTARRQIPPVPFQGATNAVTNEQHSAATWNLGEGGARDVREAFENRRGDTRTLGDGPFDDLDNEFAAADDDGVSARSSMNGSAKAWSDIAELSPGFSSDATRVVAPKQSDLEQSQASQAQAQQLGWGDREETSTQLWNGLRRPLPSARDLPPLHELNGLSDLPPLDFTNDFTNDPRRAAPAAHAVPAAARPSRLPSEARPRLPSPSVPPSTASTPAALGAGDLRASRVPRASRAPQPAAEPRVSRVPDEARAAHAARAQTLRSALRTSRPPAVGAPEANAFAVNLPHPPRPASTTTVQGMSPIAPAAFAGDTGSFAHAHDHDHDYDHASSVSASVTLDELQEQLLASIERARLQETRAYEAEQRALRAETQLQNVTAGGGGHEVVALRDALDSAQTRIRRSEDHADDVERRANASEDLVRMARLRLAEASVPIAAGAGTKANRFSLGFLMTGLAVCLLSTGVGVYFGFVSPLKKQVQTQEERLKQGVQERERTVTELKSKVESERQGLEVEAQQLRAKLDAARSESANGTPTPSVQNADADKAGRTSKRTAGPVDPDSPTRSARAIIGRYKHAKAVEAREREADQADDSSDGQ